MLILKMPSFVIWKGFICYSYVLLTFGTHFTHPWEEFTLWPCQTISFFRRCSGSSCASAIVQGRIRETQKKKREERAWKRKGGSGGADRATTKVCSLGCYSILQNGVVFQAYSSCTRPPVGLLHHRLVIRASLRGVSIRMFRNVSAGFQKVAIFPLVTVVWIFRKGHSKIT